MTTGATLCGGLEGVGIGMKQAGITHIWGIEKDDTIASVARSNGFNSITADILDIDPTTLEVPDNLHISTPCINASNANHTAELNKEGTKETALDIALGEKTAQFIDAMKPRVFTLENVYFYRKFKAFKIILVALNRNGYIYHYENLNSADYGVPQTRKRLILRAVRGALLPMLPPPEKWRGWYDAIEDLIPTLPESRFVDWQLKRLPQDLQALLSSKAFLVEGRNGNGGTDRFDYEPSGTVTTSHPPRAFIVDGKAGNRGNDVTIRGDCEPMFTITASAEKQASRAWLSHGKVVSMTPRALARFQAFPDWYELPEKKPLACKVGDSVPPLWYEKLIGPLNQ